jgi:outer membrane protein TolC
VGVGLLLAGLVLAHPGQGWPQGIAPAATERKPLPIGLDTVLHLAEEQNGQIAVAREKVQEAYVEKDLAHSCWLPSINVGPSYYRHEGGIQDFNGNLIHSSMGAVLAGVEITSHIDLREAVFAKVNAERKVWQQKGELSRITSEQLLEAATTYIDLLVARTGEAIARNILKYEEDMLEQARGIVKAEPGTQYIVEGFQGEVAALRQGIVKLHHQGDAAATRLAYLLGLGPCVELVPVDEKLIPVDLVEPTAPAEQLISQAVTSGPSVRELEQMLAVVTAAREKARGPGRFLPNLEVCAGEGAFGAGPGARLDWDNRFDLGLKARWCLTDLFTAKDQKRQADSQIQQLHLTYEDLKARLASEVQEAHAASVSGREEIPLAGEALRHAEQGYQLSHKRLKDNVPGSTTTEVMGYIRALQGTYMNDLAVISDYDKAQLRLLVLTGFGGKAACGLAHPEQLPQPPP